MGDVVKRASDCRVGVLALGVQTSGIASADEPLGPPVVTTTFSLGVGPMPDVASTPPRTRRMSTSEGDDSLYIADARSRVAAIRGGTGAPVRGRGPDHADRIRHDGNSVSVVDIGSGSMTGTIGVGASPEGIEVDPSTRMVYIANAGDDTVSVIDAESRRVTATIKVGSRPGKMGVDPTIPSPLRVKPRARPRSRSSTRRRPPSSTRLRWVETRTMWPSIHQPHCVCPQHRRRHSSVLDLDTHAVTQTIAVGLQPSRRQSIPTPIRSTSPTRRSVGVGDRFPKAVRHRHRRSRRDGPQTVAADPSTHTAWVVNFRGNSISVIER